MSEITTVGLDLAKQVFQVHAVAGAGQVVVRKTLRRGQVLTFFAGLPGCLVGIEACATAHHWARELTALGHEVRLMPPQYVKAYRKRHKNDAADAAAICEAVTRPSMRFVPIKTPAQQAALTIHRSRDLLMRQRTMLINALRGHLAEFGVIAPQGPRHVVQLIAAVRDEAEDRVPALARRVLAMLAEQLEELAARLAVIGRELLAWHRASPTSQRLATIPGIGPVTASVLAATVPDPGAFRSGREFAAWLGLVPSPELERRQGAPWRDQQAGRRLCASPPDHRRAGGTALAQASGRQPLAASGARPATPPGRGGRAGQQDGADRPSARKRRPLLRRRIDRAAVDGRSCTARRNSGPWRRKPRRSGGLGLRGQERVMVDRSSEGARATWFVQRAIKPAKMSRPRAAEPIRAGGHDTTAPMAGHMTASDIQHHAKALAGRGPSTHARTFVSSTIAPGPPSRRWLGRERRGQGCRRRPRHRVSLAGSPSPRRPRRPQQPRAAAAPRFDPAGGQDRRRVAGVASPAPVRPGQHPRARAANGLGRPGERRGAAGIARQWRSMLAATAAAAYGR